MKSAKVLLFRGLCYEVSSTYHRYLSLIRLDLTLQMQGHTKQFIVLRAH